VTKIAIEGKRGEERGERREERGKRKAVTDNNFLS